MRNDWAGLRFGSRFGSLVQVWIALNDSAGLRLGSLPEIGITDHAQHIWSSYLNITPEVLRGCFGVSRQTMMVYIFGIAWHDKTHFTVFKNSLRVPTVQYSSCCWSGTTETKINDMETSVYFTHMIFFGLGVSSFAKPQKPTKSEWMDIINIIKIVIRIVHLYFSQEMFPRFQNREVKFHKAASEHLRCNIQVSVQRTARPAVAWLQPVHWQTV